jgi:predicted O-methyltransferase YrrM
MSRREGPLSDGRASLLDAARAFARQRRRERSARGNVRPWMKFMEIEVIEELLTRSRPQKCLEWGAGYGTIYFPEFLSGGATWLAVEHDGGRRGSAP